jgi:hypothetical protein
MLESIHQDFVYCRLDKVCNLWAVERLNSEVFYASFECFDSMLFRCVWFGVKFLLDLLDFSRSVQLLSLCCGEMEDLTVTAIEAVTDPYKHVITKIIKYYQHS